MKNGVVTATIEEITPDLAQTYLQKNVNNRRMRKFRVAAYARDMKAGKWRLTGSSIQFDVNGHLIDGQQRLAAIIVADTPVPLLVVRGLGSDVQSVLDSGSKRSYADSLFLKGEKDTNILSSALSVIHRMRTGVRTIEASQPTYGELDALLQENPGIRQSVPWGRACQHLLYPSCGAAFHYIFASYDLDMADEFFTGLTTGAELEQSSPVYRLRERLIRHASDKAKLPPLEMYAIVIKAWNLFARGKPASRMSIRWRSQEPFREPFPPIYDPSHDETK